MKIEGYATYGEHTHMTKFHILLMNNLKIILNMCKNIP